MSARLTYSFADVLEIWRNSWAVSWDFETWLIKPALQLPPAVCMSWTEIVRNAAAPGGLSVGRSSVVVASDGVQLLQQGLDEGLRVIGANSAFDALVSVVKAPDYMRLLRSWVAAYEGGRVHDVFVRQKLLNLATGTYKFEEMPSGKFAPSRYNLATLAQKLCGRKLSKPIDADDDQHWRLRFFELEGVPIELYPQEAYDYALEDAIATAEVFIAQEVLRTRDKRIARNFPGKDPFFDEVRQTIACVPLKAMSAFGLRTDAPAVERLVEEVQGKIVEARADLVEAKLVRPPAYHRNTDAIVAYIRQQNKEHYFRDGEAIRLCKENYEKAANDITGGVPDGIFAYLANWKTCVTRPDWLDALIARGLVDVEHSRDTKAASKRCADAYTALGLPVPRTDSYDAEKHGALDCVSLDADACSASDDPILQVYSEYQSLAKTLSNDIPMLRAGATMPVHTRFEELRETGRTSSSKPNVQNVRRLPGIRECFIPRPGYVFVDCDFSSLELCTFAQVCMWVLGFSTLGEALNKGLDSHLMMASKILSLEYDVAKARREAGDGAVDNARTAGKGATFGRLGGLGVDTFLVYAWTNYRIRLERNTNPVTGAIGATELLEVVDKTWTELPSYFRYIKGLKDPYFSKIDEKTKREMTRYNVVQPWSGRLRAGVPYCSACNSPFQGLGSDAAKMALWLVWKATMGLSEMGRADPLFGCRPVNFVHDSIMTEVPRERCDAAARRQKELMEVAGRSVCPDVPVKVDALVTCQWSKKSQQTRVACAACGEKGKCKCGTWNTRELIPWDLRVAIREALTKFTKKPMDERVAEVARLRVGLKWTAMPEAERAAVVASAAATAPRDLHFEYLQKKEWPSDVAREAVIEMFGGENVAGRIAA